MFYVLDFPTPPSGANRTLPFRADTVSISPQNVVARDRILQATLTKGGNVSIAAWPGRVRLVAQCVYHLQTTPTLISLYRDGVMLRDGDAVEQLAPTTSASALPSPTFTSVSPSLTQVQLTAMPVPTQAATITPSDETVPACNISQEIADGVLIGYRYGCEERYNATCTLFDGSVKAPCVYPIFIPTTNLSSGKYNISVTTPGVSSGLVLSFTIPQELSVKFVKGSPIIAGRSAVVYVRTNKPVQSITCEVLTTNSLYSRNCTEGFTVFSDMPLGESRIRVTARLRAEKSVIRSALFLDGKNTSCSPYLVNSLIDVVGSQATAEFTSTGKPTSFSCLLDGTVNVPQCDSPLKLRNLTPGVHKLKVTPVGCVSNQPRSFSFSA